MSLLERSVASGVITLVLNDHERRNALSSAMLGELMEALEDAAPGELLETGFFDGKWD